MLQPQYVPRLRFVLVVLLLLSILNKSQPKYSLPFFLIHHRHFAFVHVSSSV